VAGAVVALSLAALPASASAVTATKHHLDMYKVERHITLPEFDTTETDLSCPHGDIVADGMWRVDEVGPFNPQLADPDELEHWGPSGWHLGNGVDALWAYPSSNTTYSFKFRNNTSENAQLKLWVTCIGKTTAPDTFVHQLQTTPIGSVDHNGLPGSDPEYGDGACSANDIVISPGFKINQGSAYLTASYPGPGPNGTRHVNKWTWKFHVTQANTNLTVYARCLSGLTAVAGPKSHQHRIYAYFKDAPVQHFDKTKGVWEHQISCGDEQKGLVGGFDLSHGVYNDENTWWWWLGMDPRIKTRAYKTYGAGPGGSYYLVCVNDRTSRPLYI
jgi:hypothetical protein